MNPIVTWSFQEAHIRTAFTAKKEHTRLIAHLALASGAQEALECCLTAVDAAALPTPKNGVLELLVLAVMGMRQLSHGGESGTWNNTCSQLSQCIASIAGNKVRKTCPRTPTLAHQVS